jgi:aspartate aminotransferase
LKIKSRNDDLEKLRIEIRDVTSDIIFQVKKRMKLSEEIGEIKKRLNIDVQDERVEQDVRKAVLKLSDKIGIDPDFSRRLLNILLMESIRLQQKKQREDELGDIPEKRETHLDIFRKAKQLEDSGKEIIHMEVGEPDFAPPKNVKKALVRAFDLGQYHYTETRGISKLCEAIAKKVGNSVTKEQVIITPGARFAVFATITSLLKAGDEVVTIEPAWPAYRECADFVGARAKVIDTTINSKWTPDIKDLEATINDNTKMLVLNYPNNPTGKVLNDKTLSKVLSLARDRGIYVLSDEVYSDYAFNGFKSVLEYQYEKAITISSFSKAYAMTGFRIGYAIANREILAKIAKVQATAMTSVAEPIQYSALAALKLEPKQYAKYIKERLNFITNKLQRIGLTFVYPDGAMYVFPELQNHPSVGDDITLINKLLRAGVAIAPGSGFGANYRDFVRISACQPKHLLEKGLHILGKALLPDRVT